MKYRFILLVCIVFVYSSYGQKEFYDLYKFDKNPVSKKALMSASDISDLNSEFPISWINDTTIQEQRMYVSVDGVDQVIRSKGFLFNDHQKKVVNQLPYGSQIRLELDYVYRNPINRKEEKRTINYVTSIMPYKSAFLSEEFFTSIPERYVLFKLKESEIQVDASCEFSFVVDEKGKLKDFKIIKDSQHYALDSLLKKTVLSMTTWKPALTKYGVPVKQQFHFKLSGQFGKEGC